MPNNHHGHSDPPNHTPIINHEWNDSMKGISLFIQALKNEEDFEVLQQIKRDYSWDELLDLRSVEHNETLLHTTVISQQYKSVKNLLALGVEPIIEEKNADDCTPLYEAIKLGDIRIAKILLEAGANVNSLNKGGHFPIEIACVHQNIEMLKLLISHGANLDKLGEFNLVKVAAVNIRNPEILKLFIINGAYIEAESEVVHTYFTNNIKQIIASASNTIEKIALLLRICNSFSSLEGSNSQEFIQKLLISTNAAIIVFNQELEAINSKVYDKNFVQTFKDCAKLAEWYKIASQPIREPDEKIAILEDQLKDLGKKNLEIICKIKHLQEDIFSNLIDTVKAKLCLQSMTNPEEQVNLFISKFVALPSDIESHEESQTLGEEGS